MPAIAPQRGDGGRLRIAPLASRLLLASLLLTGCEKASSSQARQQPPRPDERPRPVDFAAQARLAACPDGSTSQPDAEQGSDARVCLRPDGTRHGPAVRLFGCRDLVHVRTPYRNGKEQGDSTVWKFGWLTDEEPKGFLWPSDALVCDAIANNWKPLAELVTMRKSVYPYRDGKLHGLMTEWSSSGKKVREGRYVAGLKHGAWRQWSDTGKLLGTDMMDHGTGTERWWWDDGTRWRVMGWKLGQQHGRYAVWHDSGAQATEGRFYQGRPDGTWSQWNSDGKLLGSYQMQRGTGTIRHWHPDGKLSTEEPIRNGHAVGTSRAWNQAGVLIMESDRLRARTVTRFYTDDGVLESEETTVDERRHGPYKRYDKSGKLIEERSYERGLMQSTKTF